MSGSITRTLSPETAQNEVVATYMDELGRQPDAQGMAAYTALLLSGVPLAQIQSSIAQSPEAQADIQSLYETTLGRAADTTGLALNTQALASGSSLAQLRLAIVQSHEGQNAIQSIYEDALDGPADSGGLALDTQALAGGLSLAQLRASIAASPEAANVITGIFQNDLLRAPSAADLTVYTSALAGGSTYFTLRDGIIASPECIQTIQGLYQQYLDRPATTAEVQAEQMSLYGGDDLADLEPGLAAQQRLQASTVPDQTAALTTAYENVFGYAPVDAPNSNASTIPTLQAELSLGRPIAEVEQVIDYRQVSNDGTIDTYGCAVPAQYSTDGFSMFLQQANSSDTPETINVSSALPIPVTGAPGALGPDTITLNLAQLNTAPLTFSAALDGQPLGQATLAGATSFGVPSTGKVSFTGDFQAGQELDLTFGTIPENSLYVVSATLDGQSFLLGGAANGTGGSIALFPHANSSGVVVTSSYPY